MTAWDPTSYPDDDVLVLGDGPLWYRYLGMALQDVIEREHTDIGGSYGAVSGSYTGGVHKSGSAVCYCATTAPATRPDGETALASNVYDKGRLWMDTDYTPPRVMYWTGSAWADLSQILIEHATDMNFVLKNLEVAYTDGAKDSTLRFRGMQASTACDLAHIEAAHYGAADDHKGKLIFKVNDGDDALDPSKVALTIISDGTIDVTNSEMILDEDTMSSDSAVQVPTQQSVKAYVESYADRRLDISQAVGSTDIQVSSATPEDMADMAVSLSDVPAGSAIHVTFNAVMQSMSAQGVHTYLYIDDGAGSYTEMQHEISFNAYSSTFYSVHSYSYLVENVTGGTVRAKIMWRSQSATTMYQPGATYKRVLNLRLVG